jgi:L-lysine exporter family protein LysE/ArgO
MMDSDVFSALFEGFAISFGLIAAIGAQNAFVLRQGLRREHIGAIVIFCAVIDFILIASGVFGLAKTLAAAPLIGKALALAGSVFLAWYALGAVRRAARPRGLSVELETDRIRLSAALLQAAAFTLLNPHVYIDTVMLVGTIGAHKAGVLKLWFVFGAALASFMWFATLGFGSRWAAPLLTKKNAWRVLDSVIALTMCTALVSLVQTAFSY